MINKRVLKLVMLIVEIIITQYRQQVKVIWLFLEIEGLEFSFWYFIVKNNKKQKFELILCCCYNTYSLPRTVPKMY